MAKRQTFSADVDAWARKSERRIETVVKVATTRMINGIEIVPGINRGGSRVRGTIPRDMSYLANSLQTTLIGGSGVSASGQDSHEFVIAGFQVGDAISFSWGGDTAPHAVHVYYGANGVPGTYWIDVAAAKWQQYVDAAAREAMERVP